MSQEVYAIIDLEGYATQMRIAAAKSLSEDSEEQENLNDFITINQIINMVNNECVGYDNEDRPLLDEEKNEKIFEDTAIWIHNVCLARLAAKDLLECAWDNETNEMIFWAKKKATNGKRKSRKNKKSEG